MFLQKKSAREYSAISNNELDWMQVRDNLMNNWIFNYRFNEKIIIILEMSYGVKFRNRHQTRISQSFAKRVEESKEEDEAAGCI